MGNEKIYIGSTGSESFLICDDSLKSIDAPFYKWLKDEGFAFGGHKGHYNVCDWAYVSITKKIFGYGMPGIPFGTATGNHAITIEEFKIIYQIYKKYDGQDLFACRTYTGPHWYYVKPSDKDKRKELVDYLEFKGFECREDEITSKQSAIESSYPLIVDITRKLYGHLHNTTCAAGAASKKKIISAEEFYALYKGPDVEWEEYVAAIKEHMKNYLTVEEIEQYLVKPDTVDILNDHFKQYTQENASECDPCATAYCLWMLY